LQFQTLTTYFDANILVLNMPILTQEYHIIMAMKALQTSRKRMSRRAAAKLYNIPESTLRARITGQLSRSETRPNSSNLTKQIERRSTYSIHT
jgi:hypothetical protein